MKTRAWANGLGWFSIALGITELVASRPIARALGIKGNALVQAFGVREFASGVGVLSQRRKGPWIWTRVAGDVLDMAVLGLALASGKGSVRRNALLAIGAVAPVVALDVVCGRRLGLSA